MNNNEEYVRSGAPSEANEETDISSVQTREFIDIKDIVAATLESRGVLGKIKAQIRAAVLTVLDDEKNKLGISLEDERINENLSSTRGELVCLLIQEFLEFYHLENTLTVFSSEVECNLRNHIGRSSLAEQFGLHLDDNDKENPLLFELLFQSSNTREQSTINTPSDMYKLEKSKLVSNISKEDDDPSSLLDINEARDDRSIDTNDAKEETRSP